MRRKSDTGNSTLFRDNDDKAGSYKFKQDNEHIKKFYIVVDLEATCWEDSNPAANANSMKKKKSKKKKNNSRASAQAKGTTPPSTEREIIEIGAVLIEAQSGEFNIVEEFSIFVRPTMHPTLSEFCTKLTSITQKNVVNAPTFEEAFTQFKNWLFVREDDYRCYKFCAWGNFDAAMIETECSRINKKSPFNDTLNLKIKLLHQYKLANSKAGNLDRACATLGIEWQGNHHRAIDDARNTAVIMQRMLTDHYSKQATSNLKGDANAAAMTTSKAGTQGGAAALQSEAEGASKEKNNDDDDTLSNTGKNSP